MNKEDAIKILINVAIVAQSKGVLNLDEAAIVAQAVKIATQDEGKVPMEMIHQSPVEE